MMSQWNILFLMNIQLGNLLQSTWKSAQFCVAAWIGGKCGEGWAQVYSWPSPFALYLKLPEYYYFSPFFFLQINFLIFHRAQSSCSAGHVSQGELGQLIAPASPWGGFPGFGAGPWSSGSVVVTHGLQCSRAWEIFWDQESNPCPLHGKADS